MRWSCWLVGYGLGPQVFQRYGCQDTFSYSYNNHLSSFQSSLLSHIGRRFEAVCSVKHFRLSVRDHVSGQLQESGRWPGVSRSQCQMIRFEGGVYLFLSLNSIHLNTLSYSFLAVILSGRGLLLIWNLLANSASLSLSVRVLEIYLLSNFENNDITAVRQAGLPY